MPDKATQFHVGNAAAWQEKYPDANVTFVDLVDGIETITKSQQPIANGQLYNLAGQRVDKGYKGLNIINGKKVVIK
jgi:hypothetical protein